VTRPGAELARCEFLLRREMLLLVIRARQNASGAGARSGRLPEGPSRALHDGRGTGARTDGSAGRKATAALPETDASHELLLVDELGSCRYRIRCGVAVRGFSQRLTARLDVVTAPAFADGPSAGSERLRRAAGPAHPPRDILEMKARATASSRAHTTQPSASAKSPLHRYLSRGGVFRSGLTRSANGPQASLQTPPSLFIPISYTSSGLVFHRPASSFTPPLTSADAGEQPSGR